MTNTKGFLNRNQLKYLVIAAMLIDHIAGICSHGVAVGTGHARHRTADRTRLWRICWQKGITTPGT